MIILLRIKNHTGEAVSLRSELRQLCGDKLEDVVGVIVKHRQSLLAEFQVWVLSYATDPDPEPQQFKTVAGSWPKTVT
jgi:hypothetical protein